jgi:hypothetical protein
MLAVKRDSNADPHDRLEMAKSVAPYIESIRKRSEIGALGTTRSVVNA